MLAALFVSVFVLLCRILSQYLYFCISKIARIFWLGAAPTHAISAFFVRICTFVPVKRYQYL